LRREKPDLAAEIERRARTWIGTHGVDFPGDLETGRLGDSDEDRERFAEFANEAACPALDPATGRCDVYEWRPMTCRVFGPPIQMDGGNGGAKVLGHCELCFVGATEDEVARCEMPVSDDLEEKLLDEIPEKGETLVAFALLR
jgi:Fe-S-cluster containining protein